MQSINSFVVTLLLSLVLLASTNQVSARINNISSPSAANVSESRSGLYAVASTLPNGAAAVDISVASSTNVQMVTITAEAGGNYRAVLTDGDGQILRTRSVEGETEWDFYSLPTGTYRVVVLNASGDMLMSQTLQKR